MPNWMARRLLSQRASAGGKPGSFGAREPAAAKKPWWRFWYRGTPNHPLQQTPPHQVVPASKLPKRRGLLSGVVRRQGGLTDRRSQHHDRSIGTRDHR